MVVVVTIINIIIIIINNSSMMIIIINTTITITIIFIACIQFVTPHSPPQGKDFAAGPTLKAMEKGDLS